jgi:phage-related protein
MSDRTYISSRADRPLVWLRGEIRTPPFSASARIEAGVLLRRLQRGERLGLPHSRPMPVIASRCHELRILDERTSWRIIYRLDADAVVVADVFPKTTRRTPLRVIQDCRRRLRQYDEASRED